MAKNESIPLNKKEKKNKDKTSYFKSFKAELKKVSWPTPKQLVNNTIAVVVIVIILSAIVFVLDLAFESVNRYGIDKVKASIVTSNGNDTTVKNSDENVEVKENANETENNENETQTTENKQ